ncbi:hypothetical protein ACWDY4_31190 [Streptomyces olivaceoviridis]
MNAARPARKHELGAVQAGDDAAGLGWRQRCPDKPFTLWSIRKLVDHLRRKGIDHTWATPIRAAGPDGAYGVAGLSRLLPE